MDTTELSRRAHQALAISDSPEAFEIELQKLDVQLAWTTNRAGLKFRPAGSSTWVGASTLHRDLRASNTLAVLERNAALKREARQAAESAAAAASQHAQARVAAVLPHIVGAEPVPERSRALPPDAAAVEAATMQAQAPQGDGLDFLSSPPIQAAGSQFDDAQIQAESSSGSSTQSEAGDDADQHARLRLEREDAEAKLHDELRGMEVGTLYDLKRCDQIPPLLLTAEKIVALVNLMVKILSLGLVRCANVLATARQAREILAERAESELARRIRSPVGVEAKLKALEQDATAVRSRKLGLEARAATRIFETPRTLAMRVVVRRHDSRAAAAGQPTISGRRTDQNASAQEVERLTAERKTAKARIPVGFAGVLLSASASARLARARLTEVEKSLATARAKRDRLVTEIDSLLEDLERVAAAQIQAETRRIAEQLKAEEDELKALSIQLRVSIPQQRQAIERLGLTEKLRNVGDVERERHDVDVDERDGGRAQKNRS